MSHKALNFMRLAPDPDSPPQPAHEQKAGVKRLCQDADTLLSPPGRACDIVSGQSLQAVAAKSSGFRDIHASKGSNRA